MSQQETSIVSPVEISNEGIHTEAEVIEAEKAKTLIHPLSEAPKPRSRKRRRRLPAW